MIGGLGPIATMYFFELVIKMTNAKQDQDHLEMMIYNKPKIPDRTEFILGRSNDSPVPPMIEIGKELACLGADYLAIPCITGHYFYEELTREIPIPIIHIIKETAQHLKNHGVRQAGIMATEGTISSKVFQEELEQFGIQVILPSKKMQYLVTDLIYKNIKANEPVEMEKFEAVSKELKENGAEVIILGCTELSLIKRDHEIGPGYLDAMEVLAMRSIQECEANLKEEYQTLITK